jgi:carboxypeptidase C (cathepsin A)/glutamate/tyrosine decarboxylase-like PLP-dependent enzyme
MGQKREDQRGLAFGRTALKSAEDDGYARVAAWFLGPKGENGQFLKNTLGMIAEEHARFRSEHYKPGDPPYIDEKIRSMAAFQQAQCQLTRNVLQLMEQLRSSEPFFSPRYQGHMNWDTVLPGNLGYVAAMLYNQNNVATEASPVTSALELEVGAQLCAMIGYGDSDGSPPPWGHITADGSIANIEAMWMARNLKLYPLALRKLLKAQLTRPTYRYVETESVLVTTARRAQKPLVEATDWECLNVPPNEAVRLPEVIATTCLPGVHDGVAKVGADVRDDLVQSLGLGQYAQTYPSVSGLRVLVPATKHYSWPKAGTILGIGSDGVIGISVGDRCQMDLDELRTQLDKCHDNKIPLLTVVAVMGSTEEGAVDDLAGIVSLREEYRDKGLSFLLHCDAAWGGYLRSMMVPAGREDAAADTDTDSGYVPTVPLSSHAKTQFGCLADADTVTIDPHKAGFVPYPAGSLSYRDKRMRELITFDAAYLHSDPDTNMGIYGVEGSKPGAAAAAVWLAHKTIPLDQEGYGRLLAECNYTTKLYYCYWVTLTGENDTFDLEPLIPLPNRLVGAGGETLASGEDKVKAWIRERIVGRSNEELRADADAMAVLCELGPDVLINAFVVNKRGNTDLGTCSKLNQELFDEHFSMVKSGEKVRDDLDLILTMSALDADKYSVPLERVCRRLGLDLPATHDKVNFFINTILQPWPTTHGYLKSITEAFRTTVNAKVAGKQTPPAPAPTESAPPDLVKAVPTDVTGSETLTPGSRSYAGLVTVNEAKTNQLYYWFFERQVAGRDDANLAEVPLVVWLNGGPGASSLVGLFMENGPLRMTDCGAVTRNEFAWNRSVHLLYWDQPVGAGYANTNDAGYVTTEEQMAEQLCNGLIQFYELHPEYRTCPLYLTGESYAGKYLPYLAREVLSRTEAIPLKGVAIGDGWMKPIQHTYDQIAYGYEMGFVDTRLRDELNARYAQMVDLMMSGSPGQMAMATDMSKQISDSIVAAGGQPDIYDVRRWGGDTLDVLRTYMNSDTTKDALHVPSDVVWQFADNDGPVAKHLKADIMKDATGLIPELLDSGVRMLLYTGNFDMACGYTGTEKILWELNWSGKWTDVDRFIWREPIAGQDTICGYVKELDRLTQIVIPQSGHLVPVGQPQVSRLMLYRWIFEQTFPNAADRRQ